MKEHAHHRRAFDHYLRMGADRSIHAVHRAFQEDPSRIGLRHGPSRSTLERWSSAFHWQDRLVDLERAAHERDRRAHVEALHDMNERHKKEGLALQQKALERIAAMPADGLKPGDAIRALIEGVRLERLAAGAPTERIEQQGGEVIDGRDLRRFSIEELRVLAEAAERRATGDSTPEPG